ncbi:MAG: heavy metal-binding domain-containing protein [Actinomycetota bacterium]|nr:heavy metal-binding domain-containing protein [Actinomycetota bacterium]
MRIRRQDTDDSESELSRRELEEGRLPLAAQRRLHELAASEQSLFTSDLTVNEFALLHREGIVPITQVMGSSIFQHAWQTLPMHTWYGYGGNVPSGGAHELKYLSDAFNQARERALSRLRQEAELAGAEAVLGVHLNTGGHEFAGRDVVEFTAVGTAVRLPENLKDAQVLMSDLSGQDYVKLAQAGYRPVGVVGHSTVMYVASSWEQNRVLSSGNNLFSAAGRANQELPDFTRGFYDAREVAIGNLSRQAKELGADGVVGVTIGQHINEREYEDAASNQHHDLIVYIHLLGTAIRDGHAPLQRPDPTTIMPLSAASPRTSRQDTR